MVDQAVVYGPCLVRDFLNSSFILYLTGEDNLFQQAARRLKDLENEKIAVTAPYVVTNDEHRFLASEQLRESDLDLGATLLESVGCNTAPALTLAGLATIKYGDDPILVVIPADQTISETLEFTRSMHHAIHQAAQGDIVSLGVPAERPETGYGHIKTNASTAPTFDVASFVEKPDSATARRYLEAGGYFWNAGMFVLKASLWLETIDSFRPDIAGPTRRARINRITDAAFIRPDKEEFFKILSVSRHYAVMERCPECDFSIKMAPLNVLPKDNHDNAHLGDVLTADSHNTLIHVTSRLVALVGVENLVVIETPDAVLVADKSGSQDVTHIVNMLKQQQREERTLHRKVHRPWGWYDSVDEGERFKVKRIQVNPEASLSLQNTIIAPNTG